jgi:cytochrome c
MGHSRLACGVARLLLRDGAQTNQGDPAMNRSFTSALATAGIIMTFSVALAAEGNPARGQRVFGACAACHSLEPNRSMTGPSLAELWQRRAGSLSSFPRYSPALKSSGMVWNDQTLDIWLQNPAHFIPGNTMTFRGIAETQQRADLLAFLKEATKPDAPQALKQAQGGMMGMMGSGAVPNLKKLDPEDRVRTITYCTDTYRVITADGKMHAFWERNLRFKTDGGEDGPEKKAPALVGAGMMGDRADVIFAEPEEISGLIVHQC